MATNWATRVTDTLAELKATKGVVSTAAKMCMLGRAFPYDGGQGDFVWDNTSTATDNDGTIIQPVISGTPVATGRWIRNFNGVYSVRWWGATGDGVTDDSIAIRKCIAFVKSVGGGEIYFPAGTYIVSRRVGSPNDIMQLSSNMKVSGEGMTKTKLKLNPTDLKNFRRMFNFDDAADVSNVEISHLEIDMSNTFTTYPPSDAVTFPDAQNAGIFVFSTSHTITNCYFHDLFIHDVTGDVIGVSKNANNVTIDRIYQRDYLRQGISVGGSGGVNNIFVSKIFDLPFVNGVIKGGNSIHCEPSVTVTNLNYRDCVVQDFSASGVNGGVIDNVTALSNNPVSNVCNNIQNFNIINCSISGRFQISPAADNVTVSNCNLNDGLVVTSVGGVGLRSVNNISVNNNNIITSTFEAVKIDNVDAVMVTSNNIRHSGDTGIYVINALSGRVSDNKIRTTGNFYSIYCAITVAANYGRGFFVIFDNEVYNTYRGISGSQVSMVVGPNFVSGTVTRVHIQGANTKYFAHSNGNGQTLTYTAMPTWGEYSLGDEIRVIAGTVGSVLKYVCTRAGALHMGAWSGVSTYVINDYVLGSDNKVYKSTVVGGQAIDPVTDTGNTYWVIAGTLAATFTQVGIVGLEFVNTGTPESVVTAPVSAITHDNTGTNGNIYVKKTGSGNTGWRMLAFNSILAKTSTYGLTVADSTVYFGNSANCIAQLPAASACPNQVFVIKKTGNNAATVTVTPSGSETFDTAANIVLTQFNEAVAVQSNGTNFVVLSRYYPVLPVSAGGTGLATLGSALQQQRVNAAGTAIEYFTPSTVVQTAGPIKDFYADATGADTLYSYTVAASFLPANGSKVRFTYAGYFAATATSHIVGVSVAGTTIAQMSNGTTSGGTWRIEGTIIRVSNTVVRYVANLFFDNTGVTTNLAFNSVGELTGLDIATNGLPMALAVGSPNTNVTATMGSLTYVVAAP